MTFRDKGVAWECARSEESLVWRTPRRTCLDPQPPVTIGRFGMVRECPVSAGQRHTTSVAVQFGSPPSGARCCTGCCSTFPRSGVSTEQRASWWLATSVTVPPDSPQFGARSCTGCRIFTPRSSVFAGQPSPEQRPRCRRAGHTPTGLAGARRAPQPCTTTTARAAGPPMAPRGGRRHARRPAVRRSAPGRWLLGQLSPWRTSSRSRIALVSATASVRSRRDAKPARRRTMPARPPHPDIRRPTARAGRR
jgi:hypothetical protein